MNPYRRYIDLMQISTNKELPPQANKEFFRKLNKYF